MTPNTHIPQSGIEHQKLLQEMQSFQDGDMDWASGRTWSLVYFAGEAHHTFLKKAHNLYFAENALNPLAFKGLKRMENEVVRMTCSMLNGGPETVGTMSSGGTESILLAVKAYRDRARKTKPWIRNPEMVVAKTVHVAFDKAAHYFGVKPKYVEIGPDYRVNTRAMEKAITRNTIFIAGSAPQYPQGVVDPIEQLGQIALAHKVPLHVDACIGGFMLPWVERLGYRVPLWDFRVPGVTSISADVHKYGYAAKGASVICYRDMSYLKHQFFVSTDWSGGIYASPSIPGTRSGGPIAAAWAAMMAMGEDGYLRLAEQAMNARAHLMAGIEEIAPLKILGQPHSTIICYTSADPEIDIYAIADQLEIAGWDVGRQQNPNSLHLTINGNHIQVADEYLADLQAAVDHVRAHPGLKSEGNAAMYGMMAKVPFRGLVKHSVLKIMEQMYGANPQDPDLSTVGESEDDGMVLQAINKYGDQALAFLDQSKILQSVLSRIGRR